MTWGKKTRPLPNNWPTLKRQTFERAGYRCEWSLSNGTRCPDRAEECDHRLNRARGGSDELDNLQALCSWHHGIKTKEEAAEARRAAPRLTSRHPGENPSGHRLW